MRWTCAEEIRIKLRKLRVQMKGKKLPDGKLLSGAGRLTDKKIDTLQNFYGLAMRQHKDDLLGMQRSVLATLYHVASTDDAFNHSFCPTGSYSWCKNNVNADNYHHKHGLPPAVLDIVEPIFSDLADCDLLSKCHHGKTQNNNESINNLVWRYCPKEVYVSRSTVADAANLAVAVFNDGNSAFLKLFNYLGIKNRRYTCRSIQNTDSSRLYHAKRKSGEGHKQDRKRRRAVKKGFIDKKVEEEGNVYEAGAH